jgi:hypothetical protein
VIETHGRDRRERVLVPLAGTLLIVAGFFLAISAVSLLLVSPDLWVPNGGENGLGTVVAVAILGDVLGPAYNIVLVLVFVLLFLWRPRSPAFWIFLLPALTTAASLTEDFRLLPESIRPELSIGFYAALLLASLTFLWRWVFGRATSLIVAIAIGIPAVYGIVDWISPTLDPAFLVTGWSLVATAVLEVVAGVAILIWSRTRSKAME